MKNNDYKIDFVVTWVDGNDPEWQSKMNKYKSNGDVKKSDSRKERYRDMDCLKYWFRGIEKYAPWVNKIYFVTCGQKPEWLNEENPKLVLVNHEDYMPTECLPTFNSNAIEAKFNKIKGLSETFVYFNDDMFLINKVKPTDFFKNNIPCDTMVFEPLMIAGQDGFYKKIANDIEIVNRHFSFKKYCKNNKKKLFSLKQGKYLFRTISLVNYPFFVGFHNFHLPVSYLKSTFEEVIDKESKIIEKTLSFKFRNNVESVNHWLYQYWQFASGNFVQRRSDFGKFTKLTDNNEKYILRSKYKILCINDSYKDVNFDEQKQKIIDIFETKFPEKSSFEK